MNSIPVIGVPHGLNDHVHVLHILYIYIYLIYIHDETDFMPPTRAHSVVFLLFPRTLKKTLQIQPEEMAQRVRIGCVGIHL